MSRKRPAATDQPPYDAQESQELISLLVDNITQTNEARQVLMQAKHTIQACLPVIDHMDSMLSQAHSNNQQRLNWIANEQATLMLFLQALNSTSEARYESCSRELFDTGAAPHTLGKY